MKSRKFLLTCLFLSGYSLAQSYDPTTGQSFDAYGRPLASIEQLCREGQRAGGPITEKCAINGYRFDKNGERLVNYDFTKWGYNLLDRTVTEKMAVKLDADPKFRAAYIKSHHIQPYVKHVESDDDVIGMRDGKPITRASQREFCAANKYAAGC